MKNLTHLIYNKIGRDIRSNEYNQVRNKVILKIHSTVLDKLFFSTKIEGKLNK